MLKNIKQKDKKEIAEKLKDALGDEFKFPRAHWKRIRTTNGVERINKEFKRKSRVAGAFSSDRSLLRVMGCILMDINEDWITGNRCLSMEEE